MSVKWDELHIAVRLPFKIHDSSQTKGYIIIFACKVLGLPVEEDLFHFTASKYNGTVHRHKIFLQFGTILLHIGVFWRFFKLKTQEIRNWHKLVFRSFVFIILFESWKPSRRVMIGQHFPFTETKKNLGISHLKSIELVKELINSKNSTISYFILKFGWFVALKLFQVGFKYLSPITFRILVSLR